MLLFKQDWIKNIVLDDLPEPLQHLVLTAEEEGLDRNTAISFTLLVGREMGGQMYPVPKVDKIITSLRRRLIVQELERSVEYARIARTFGVTEQWVREIHHTMLEEKRKPKQQALF